MRVSRRLVPSGFPSSGQAINCAVDADQTSISQSFFRDGGSDFPPPIVELLNTRITRNPVLRYFSSVSSPPDIDLNSRVEGCREISICLRENLPCKLAGCRYDLKTPHITLGRAIMRRPKPCLLNVDQRQMLCYAERETYLYVCKLEGKIGYIDITRKLFLQLCLDRYWRHLHPRYRRLPLGSGQGRSHRAGFQFILGMKQNPGSAEI